MTDLDRFALQHGGTITGIRREALESCSTPALTCGSGHYVFWIPNFLPPSLNALMNCHWRRKHKLKKECLELVAVYGALVPKATKKRRVLITLVRSGRRRRFDDDNTKKAINDALVGCGLLVDDSPDWVECPDPVQVKGTTTETRVELQDLTTGD